MLMKYSGSLKDFTHYLSHNMNIDENMMDSWMTFIYLMSVERVRSKI
jgi:hypothetical protein